MKLTTEELDAIRERLSKATPGPWKAMAQGNQFLHSASMYFPSCTDRCVAAAVIPQLSRPWNPFAVMGFMKLDDANESRFKEDDAEFIAHAPTDISALLAHIEALTKDCDEWRETATYLKEREG